MGTIALENSTSSIENTNKTKVTINSSVIRNSDGGIMESVDKTYAKLGDIVTYSFLIVNGENVAAQNIVFTDKIPDGLEFITNSVIVNGTLINNTNPISGIPLGTALSNQNIILSFKCNVIDIPNQSKVENFGSISYQVRMNPNMPPINEIANSNKSKVDIVSAYLVIKMQSVPQSAVVGDNILYELKITNYGNAVAENIVVTDTLAESLEFADGSVTIDGESKQSETPIRGIGIERIGIGRTAIVTYNAVLLNASKSGVINTAFADYYFKVDPEKPTKQGESKSNVNKLIAEVADLTVTKVANTRNASIGDMITYTVTITNRGTVNANNIIFVDNLPSSLRLVDRSFILNDQTINSVDIRVGVNIGSLKPRETCIIQYKVKLLSIECGGIVTNQAFTIFKFKSSWDSEVREKITKPVSSAPIIIASPTFKQLSVDEVFKIPCQKPDIKDISEVAVDIAIKNYHVIKTSTGISNQNQRLTGNKLIITGTITQNIEYTALVEDQSVHFAQFSKGFTTYIILAEDYIEGKAIQVDAVTEDISYRRMNERKIFVNVTFIINANTL